MNNRPEYSVGTGGKSSTPSQIIKGGDSFDPHQDSVVKRELNDLQSAVSNLHEQLGYLYNRLNPIILSVPSTTEQAGKEAYPSMCSVAEAIMQQRKQVTIVTEKVSYMIQSIQI